MNFFQPRNRERIINVEGETFHEQWVAGTYLVVGVFPRHCRALTINQLKDNIPDFFDLLRKNKRAIWPRGICAYYAIPIYIAEEFDRTVIDWVHRRPGYKYAMWHEPVLYNTKQNTAETFNRQGIFGSAFQPFLSQVISTSLDAISKHQGHLAFPVLNCTSDI